MSIWCTINGTIRFDHVSVYNKFDTDFGNTCTFNSSDEEWAACTVPRGSEGSLQYKYIEYENEDSTCHGQLIFWGDLRDFETKEHPKIIEWLNKCCEGKMIRSGVVNINNIVYICDEDEKWVEYHKYKIKEALKA